MTDQPRTRVGVIAGYMSLFDSIMPEGYREDRAAWAKTLLGRLPQGRYEWIDPGLLVDRRDGLEAAEFFAMHPVDVFLIIPTMAAPPLFAWEAVEPFAKTPLVVWDAHELTRIPDDYTMSDLVRHSSNVGTIMFTNTALRHGRTPQLVVSRHDDAEAIEKLGRLLTVGGVAGRMARSGFGQIGEVIEGYVNVTAEPEEVQRVFGMKPTTVSPEQFMQHYLDVTEAECEEAENWIRQYAEVEMTASDAWTSSIRTAATLQRISRQSGWIGGAFHCRGGCGLQNPAIGTLGCLGVSYMTSRGIPFTCTGDIVTALAMTIGKQLGKPVLYCECDAIDYERDLMLMANTGEIDFGMACGRPKVIDTEGHSGQEAKGASLFMEARPGPATLIGCSPKAGAKGGWTLIAARGEIVGTAHHQLKVGNCLFRFEAAPAQEAFRQWCLAGATHHGALTLGALAEEVEWLGQFLGIETRVI